MRMYVCVRLSKHNDTKKKLRNCEILMVIGEEGGGLTKLCLLPCYLFGSDGSRHRLANLTLHTTDVRTVSATQRLVESS